MCFSCSQDFSVLSGLLFSKQVMDRLSSSASAVPSIDDFSEQNMWNPLLEMLFPGARQWCIFASCLMEIDLAKIVSLCS